MSMEKSTYRINLEAVIGHFPNDTVLTLHKVSQYLRKDQRTLKKNKHLVGMFFPVGEQNGITRESLAHWISGGK